MAPLEDDLELCKLICDFFLKSTELICSLATTDNKRDSLRTTDGQANENTSKIPQNSELLDKWAHFNGTSPLPPLVVEVFLDITDCSNTHLVQLEDVDHNLWYVCHGQKKNSIMLARWLIELDVDSAVFKSSGDTHTLSVSNSTISEQITLLLRYLQTVIDLLPIQDLVTSILQGTIKRSTNILAQPKIEVRVLDGRQPIPSKRRVGLNKPIITMYNNSINKSNVPPHLEQRTLTPIWTKHGLLRISVSYRRDCTFIITDDGERYNLKKKSPVPIKNDSNVAQKSLKNSYLLLETSPSAEITPFMRPGRVPVSLPSRSSTIRMGNPHFLSLGSGDKFTHEGSFPKNYTQYLQMNKLCSRSSSFGTDKSISNDVHPHSDRPVRREHNSRPYIGSRTIYLGLNPHSKFNNVSGLRENSLDRMSLTFSNKGSPKLPSQYKEATLELLEFVKSLDERPELGMRNQSYVGAGFAVSSALEYLSWDHKSGSFNKDEPAEPLRKPDNDLVERENVNELHNKYTMKERKTRRSHSYSPHATLPQPQQFHHSIQGLLSPSSVDKALDCFDNFLDHKENRSASEYGRNKLSLRGSISMNSLKSELRSEFGGVKKQYCVCDELLTSKSILEKGFGDPKQETLNLERRRESASAAGIRSKFLNIVNGGIHPTSDAHILNHCLMVTRNQAQAEFYRRADISSKELLSEFGREDFNPDIY